MPRTTLAATALSLVAALAACTNSDRPQPTEPAATDQQTTSAPSPAPTSTSTRPLTYTDDYVDDWRCGPPRWLIQSIRYGDHTLRPGIDVMHMDLTDDGLALVANNGGIYFTDESSVEKIGNSNTIEGFSWIAEGVKSANSGSLLAWFAPTRPDRSLVVYDTRERQVLAEVPTPGCGAYDCQLAAVVGDRVYWSTPDSYSFCARVQFCAGRPLMALDVPSGRVFETKAKALMEDLRAHPRAFVAGDTFATGQVMTDESNWQATAFTPQGSTLELRRVVRVKANGDQVFAFGGFDTTGRRLNLRLPDGYTPAEHPYALFQWLDDDRFAVMPGATHENGWMASRVTETSSSATSPERNAPWPSPGPLACLPATAAGDGFRLVPHRDVPN